MSFHQFYEYSLSNDDANCLCFILNEYLSTARKFNYKCRNIKDFVYYLLLSSLKENEALALLIEAIYYLPRLDILYECSIKYDDYKDFEFGKYIKMERILLFKLFNACSENEFKDFTRKFYGTTSDTDIFDDMEYIMTKWQTKVDIEKSFEYLLKYHRQSDVPDIISGYRKRNKQNHELIKVPNVVESKDIVVTLEKGDICSQPKFLYNSDEGPKSCDYNADENYPYPEHGSFKSVCLIFNIRNYAGRKRVGTELDTELIRETFASLHFSIQVIDDASKDRIFEVADIYSDVTVENAGSMFVCFILAHGEKDYIFDINEERVSIRELSMRFSAKNCEGYRQKPKVFFVQACQGQNYQQIVSLTDKTYSVPQVEHDGFTVPKIKEYKPHSFVPEEADFIMGMSTVPDCVAFREKRKGSWYITELCKAIQEKASKAHLVEILTCVNFTVTRKQYGKRYCQLPIFCSTAMKKCYLTIPKDIAN